MLWKLLSGIAAVLLALGAYFSFTNLDSAKTEKNKGSADKANLEEAKQAVTKKAEEKTAKEKDLVEVKKRQEESGSELNKIKKDIVDKTQEAEGLKKTLEDITKNVASIEEQIQKAGDVKALAGEVEKQNAELKSTEAAIANEMQQKSMAEEKLTAVKSDIKKLEEVNTRQKAGVVEPGFTARVSQSYPNFGFVVLNKGVSNGMFARAALDVKRGGSVVAKLTVRDVETHSAVADLVPGSVGNGDVVRPGDLVVASSTQPKLEEEKAAAGPSTPVVHGPGAAVPGAAPAGAPPAPAPAMADPFSSTPSGTPPAAKPPGAADPFGATPPAAPGAAPAAGAPGTPANPSKADPFGAAPAGTTPPATPPAGQPPATDPFAPKK